MADLPARVSETGRLAADGGEVSTRDGGGGTLEAVVTEAGSGFGMRGALTSLAGFTSGAELAT